MVEDNELPHYRTDKYLRVRKDNDLFHCCFKEQEVVEELRVQGERVPRYG